MGTNSKQSQSRFELESLEPRVLLSADAFIAAAAVGAAAGTQNSHSQVAHERVISGTSALQETAYNPELSTGGMFEGMVAEAVTSTPVADPVATPAGAAQETSSTTSTPVVAAKAQAVQAHVQAATASANSASTSTSTQTISASSTVDSGSTMVRQLTQTLNGANGPPAATSASTDSSSSGAQTVNASTVTSNSSGSSNPAIQSLSSSATADASASPHLSDASPLNLALLITDQLATMANGNLTDATLGPVNASLGGAFAMNGITVTFSGITHSGSTITGGTVTIAATSASLTLGTAVTSSTGTITGSYDVTTKKFSLTANSLSITFSNFVTITAASVGVSYDNGSSGTSATITDGTNPTTVKNVSILTIGASDVTIFAGINAGSPSAAGVSLSHANLALAILKPTNAADNSVYYSLKANATNLSLVGLPAGVTLDSGDLDVQINSGNDGNKVVDFSMFNSGAGLEVPGSTEFLDFDQAFLRVAGTLDFGVTDYIHLTGSFSFEKTASQVTINVGHTAFEGASDVQFILGSESDPFFSATAYLSMRFDTTSFSILTASITLNGEFRIGSLLSVDSPGVTLSNLTISKATGQITGVEDEHGVIQDPVITITAASASLFPGGGALTATVTGLTGTFNLRTYAFSIHLDEFNMAVSSFMTANATDVLISYDPTNTDVHQQVVAIGEGAIEFSTFNLQGSISNLTIYLDGFHFDSLTLAPATPGTEITLGSVLKVTDPSLTLTDFSYNSTTDEFSGSISVHADEASLTVSAFVASAEDLTITIDLTQTNFGNLNITAGTMTFEFGSYVTITATDVGINTQPLDGDAYLYVGAATVNLKIGTALNVNGTATDFSLVNNGGTPELEEGPNFSVSVGAGGSTGSSLHLPSWLGFQIEKFEIKWDHFTTHPEEFTIVLSASITSIAGLPGGVVVSGFIKDAVIDTTKLLDGDFPLTSIGSFGGSVSGTLFGLNVHAGFVMGIVNLNSDGQIVQNDGLGTITLIDADTGVAPTNPGSTTVVSSVLYVGVTGGAEIPGIGGVSIYIGFSELGPLTVYLSAETQLILDPNTGLAIGGFSGGIIFNQPMPVPNQPTDLRTLNITPGNITISQWQQQLMFQTVRQFNSSGGGENLSAAYSQPFIIAASVTLFDAYLSRESFELTGSILIGINPNPGAGENSVSILITGDLTLAGGTMHFKGYFYLGVSTTPTTHVSVMFLLDVPSPVPGGDPIESIGGSLSFQFLGITTDTENHSVTHTLADGTTYQTSTYDSPATTDSFYLNISGFVRYQAQNLASVTVTGSVSFTFIKTATQTTLTIDVWGNLNISFLGDIAVAQGQFVIIDRGSGLEFYGALRVSTAAGVAKLEEYGLHIDGAITFQINTTGDDQIVYLPNAPPGSTPPVGPPDPSSVTSFTIDGNVVFDLTIAGTTTPYASLAYSIEGDTIFSLEGFFDFRITHDSSGFGVQIFANIHSLQIGPSGNPFITFSGFGLFVINGDGFAALMNLTLTANQIHGVTLQGDFTLVINTTSTDVTYNIPPAPLPPSVSGGDSIPAVTIYDTDGNVVGTATTLIIPKGPPRGTLGLTGGTASFSETGATGPYVVISGSATLDISLPVGGDLSFNGYFRFELSHSASGLLVSLVVHMDGNVPTRGSVTLDGAFQVSGDGVVALLSIGGSSGSKSYGPNVTFEGSFSIMINSTEADVDNIGGVALPVTIHAGDYLIQASGTLSIYLTPNTGFQITGIIVAGQTTINGNTVDILTVNGTLTATVGGTKLLSLSANGALLIAPGEIGIAGYLNVSLDGGGLLNGSGFAFSGSFTLEVNTTTSSWDVPVGNSSVTIDAGPYSMLHINGDLAFGSISTGFVLHGDFYMSVSAVGLIITTDVTFQANLAGQTLMSLNAVGGLMITSEGIAASFTLSTSGGSPLSGTGFTFSANFSLKVNTTSSHITQIGSLAVDLAAGPYFQVSGSGSIAFGTSTGVSLDGSFTLTISSAGLAVTADATLKVIIAGETFFSLEADGALLITGDGIAAKITLGLGVLPGDSVFSFTGSFVFALNTMNHGVTTINNVTVNLPTGFYLHIAGTAHLKILTNVIDIYGSFDFTIVSGTVHIEINAGASILGAGFTVLGNATISNDGLVLFVVLKLGTDTNPTIGIAGVFSVQGTFVLGVNSTGQAQSAVLGGTTYSMTATQTLKVQVQNAALYVFGFKFTGNLTFLIDNGIFKIVNSSVTLDFFGFFSLTVTVNYLDSTGKFNLYVYANIINFGNDFFGISASVELKFANWDPVANQRISLFSIHFVGSVHVLGVGAGLDAYVEINGSSVEIAATVTLDFWLFSVDITVHIHLGSTASVTPPPPPLGVVVGGVLTLYLGNYVNPRGIPAQADENFQLSAGTNAGEVVVYAPGITPLAQTFTGVTSIFVDCGGTTSNTLIQVAGTVTAPITITAGSGTNHFLMGGGHATITGTNGNDTVSGGSGGVTFTTGSGHSVFTGGASTNNIIYDPGTVEIIQSGYHNYTLTDSLLSYDGYSITLVGHDFDITLAAASTGLATFAVTNSAQHVTLDANGNASATVRVTLDGNLTLTGATITESNGGQIVIENTVASSPLPSLALDGGAGDNTFTVNSWSGTTPLVMDGKGGSDTFKVNFVGSGTYTVSVQDTGATGTDLLLVNGTPGNDTLTVSSNQISRATEVVNYSGVETIILNTFNGNDTVNVNNPSAAITIVGGSGNDTFNVNSINSNLTITTGTGMNTINVPVMNNIHAKLTVNGGGAEVVYLNDTADNTANTGTLGATTLTGFFGAGGSMEFSAIETMNLDLGNGGNTLILAGRTGLTNITTGSGLDTVNIRASGGVTNLNIGAGPNTVNVGSLAPLTSGGSLADVKGTINITSASNNNTLFVDDSGSTKGNVGTLWIDHLQFFDPVRINFAGVFSLMTISLGQGADIFAITDTFTSASVDPVIVVNGNGGDDIITILDTHAVVEVNGGDGNDSMYVFGNSSVLNLNGDDGDDTFYIYASLHENTSNVDPGDAPVGNTIYSYRNNAVVNIDGGTGHDRVFIFATVLNDIIIIDGLHVTGAGLHVNFVNIEELIVVGLGGDDVFYVLNVAVNTTIIGDGSLVPNPPVPPDVTLPDTTGGAVATSWNDTFYIGWKGQSYIPGSLSTIQASLTIIGSEGTDTAYIDDSGATANTNYTLDGTSFISSSMGADGVIYYDNTIDNLNIKAGAGDDTITVNGNNTGLQTTIYGGAGNDHFVVNAGPLGSPLALVGDANTFFGDTLTVNGAGEGNNFVITGFTVDGLGATISYATIELLTVNALGASNFTVNGDSVPTYLNGGVDSDTFTINSSNTPLFLDGGAGADTFLILGNSGPLSAKGGAGNDSFTINGNGGSLDLVGGDDNDTFIFNGGSGNSATANGGAGDDSFTVNTPLATTILVIGGGGNDTLTVNGSVGNDFWVITNSSVGGVGSPVNYTDLDVLVINGISGNDTFNVRSTAPATTLNTGTGLNTINVGSLAPVLNGNVNGIQGALTVVGNGNDVLNIDDTGSSTGKTDVLTATALTGMGMGVGGITFAGLATLNLGLGSGGDTLTIVNTPAAAVTNISGNNGADVFNIQGTMGVTNINAGADNDIFNFGSLAPLVNGTVNAIAGLVNIDGGSGTDVFNVDDSGDTLANAGQLTTTSLTGLGMGAGVNYAGIETVNVKLGLAADTFNIISINATTTVNTGGGSNTINVCSNAPGTGGTVNNITGALIVVGNGNDTLNIDDTGDTAANDGNLTPTTVTGLGMGVAGITYTGLLHLNISLGSGNDTFRVDDMTDSTITVVNGGGGIDSATLNFNTNFAAVSLTLLNFETGTLRVFGNFTGVLHFGGTLTLVDIDGTLGSAGVLTALNIDTMTVDGDFAGMLDVFYQLDTLAIYGGAPGTISAAFINLITVRSGYGNMVLHVIEFGINREIQALPVGGGTLPDTIRFQVIYDSVAPGDPQAAIFISNSGAVVPNSFDLVLLCQYSGAKFNLALVYASGPTGLSNVTVFGDILVSLTAAERDFLGLPVSMASGVNLAYDNITGVSVSGALPVQTIIVKGIEGISFGTLTSRTGRPISVSSITISSLTGPVIIFQNVVNHPTLLPAVHAFRIAFNGQQPVKLFAQLDQAFRLSYIATFSDQLRGNQPLTAVVQLQPGATSVANTNVTSINIYGDGASIDSLYSVANITSTGALGNITVRGTTSVGLGNITAPSIFGSINVTKAGITGVIQTTGLWTDPFTGMQQVVNADLGGLVYNSKGKVTGVTSIISMLGITGQIISRGDLISSITTKGAFTGLISAQGNIGAVLSDGGAVITNAAGVMTRYGGINVGATSGQIVALGNILCNVTISGAFTGRIAVEGLAMNGLAPTRFGILGNLSIKGTMDTSAAIISGGLIGDVVGKTTISWKKATGFLASLGAMNIAKSARIDAANVFANAQGTANGEVISAVFTDGLLPLSFDTGGDFQGLALIRSDLNALTHGSGGLSGTTP